MQTIQIRRPTDTDWLAAELVSAEQPDTVEVTLGGEQVVIAWENVHPADQVMLTVERQARQRYVWVPREDLDQPG